jgi:tyrosyl-tRNA synthetase
MLEREDFRSRLQNNQPISVHELLYPLLTARDAVELKSDVELGATEQKFNLLVHREIQREYGLPGQAILTMPILVGLDGQRKMSKSLGNYVGITEPPQEMFGKLMSIPDDLMWSYYELLTDRTPQDIAALKNEVASGALHPMEAKMRLAEEVISDFHDKDAARKAADNFQRVFRDRQVPAEMEEVTLTRVPGGLMTSRRKSASVSEAITIPLSGGLIRWSKLLADLGEVSSASEAERVIKQNGFEMNGQPVSDPTSRLNVDLPGSYEIRYGKKKFLRIVVLVP